MVRFGICLSRPVGWWIQSGRFRSDKLGRGDQSGMTQSLGVLFGRIFKTSRFSFYNYLANRDYRDMVNELSSCTEMCGCVMIVLIDFRNGMDLT